MQSGAVLYFFVPYEQRYKNVNSSAALWTPCKTTDGCGILSMIKNNSFTTAYQTRTTLKEAGVSLSRSTNQRCLTEWKYRKFRTCCKALGGTQGYTLWSDSDKMLQNQSDYILQCKRMMIQGWLQKKQPTSLSKQRNGDILQFAKSVTRARFSRAAWV